MENKRLCSIKVKQSVLFKQNKMDKEKRLYRAFLTLKSPKEVESFLKDLCTASETKDFSDRLEIAVLLEDSALSYREIAERTGASLTTVTRVAKFLKNPGNTGYKTVLKRLKKAK